ncbi:hypothetical protein Y032_0004g2165 [Ancylostoma ceylanicum]|uniref:PRA1 family protein n=1 Tax=Ancylostoma ceylanicum TaxID=53326 RepID=A0A016VXH2_9BILA|nr:hypothetical protein Y032_0004g2165 [Ancylostoma ceylanicum]
MEGSLIFSFEYLFSWSPRSKRLQYQKSPPSSHAIQSQGCCVTAASHFASHGATQKPCDQTRRDHPLITLGAIILACYFFIQVLPSVLTVLFSVLFPLFIILCHASIRLRDFMSKVTQTAEKLGLRTTVMGRILETCGITVKA